MTRTFVVITGAVIWLSIMVSGCGKADITPPDYASMWRTPTPPATIAPADPNDKSDLIRENTELRNRVDYLRNQNAASEKKYAKLAEDMTDIRQKTEQYASERDRYKAAAGK